MSKLAIYSTIGGIVNQWFDEDIYGPPLITPANKLSILTLSDDQWADRADPSWVVDGNLTTTKPPLAPEEILGVQSEKLRGLKQLAEAQKLALSNRIGTLNDAIDLEMATPAEEAELPLRIVQLKAWKTYAVLLGRVMGQAGWPPDVDWPVQPTAGMDLTVSATAPDVV